VVGYGVNNAIACSRGAPCTVSTGFFVNYTTTAAPVAAPYSDDDDDFLATAGGKAVVILVPVVAIVVAVVAVRRRYARQDALDGEAPFPSTEDDDGGLPASTTSSAVRAGKRSHSSKSRRLHRSDRAAAQRLASDPPVDQQPPLVAGDPVEMHRVSVLDSRADLPPFADAHENLLSGAHGAAVVTKPAEPFEFL
jgi:hypothetical protein